MIEQQRPRYPRLTFVWDSVMRWGNLIAPMLVVVVAILLGNVVLLLAALATAGLIIALGLRRRQPKPASRTPAVYRSPEPPKVGDVGDVWITPDHVMFVCKAPEQYLRGCYIAPTWELVRARGPAGR